MLIGNLVLCCFLNSMSVHFQLPPATTGLNEDALVDRVALNTIYVNNKVPMFLREPIYVNPKTNVDYSQLRNLRLNSKQDVLKYYNIHVKDLTTTQAVVAVYPKDKQRFVFTHFSEWVVDDNSWKYKDLYSVGIGFDAVWNEVRSYPGYQ